MAMRRPSNVLEFQSSVSPLTGASTISHSPDTVAGTGAAPAEVAQSAVVGQTARITTLQDLGNGKVLIHPLYLTSEQLVEEWHAISNDLALVGRGESEFEAIDDLREQIAELFDTLSDLRETLGPALQQQLYFLERLAGIR